MSHKTEITDFGIIGKLNETDIFYKEGTKYGHLKKLLKMYRNEF